MDLTEVSEINMGLILLRRLSPLAVRPDTLISPYDKMLKEINNAERIDMDHLALKFGPTLINAALDAAKKMNGLGTLADWPKIQEESAAMYQAGITMEKLSRKLQAGELIDWSKVSEMSRAAQIGLAADLVTLDQITPQKMPFIPTGWKALDDHIEGLPKVGLLVVGGRPGVGKTWFMANLITRYTRLHTEMKTAVFSLEMTLGEIAERFKGDEILERERPTEEEQKRMYFCEKILSGEEIVQKCTTIPELGLVVIDFADLTVRGEANEATMSTLYKTLANGAKELGCTIVLLSQLNSAPGIPKPSSLRWTRLAEALGWMVIMLYDPGKDWTVDEGDADALPIQDGNAYIIVWKVRGGFRKHIDDSPGAILLPFKGKFGWHPTKSKWFTLKKYEK